MYIIYIYIYIYIFRQIMCPVKFVQIRSFFLRRLLDPTKPCIVLREGALVRSLGAPPGEGMGEDLTHLKELAVRWRSNQKTSLTRMPVSECTD